ncbi:MAG: prolipoprotein diacylglyceryl transferase [Flavobacterium sp.]|uniref:prolipoprotein diacylglyceryl transferase n=1 Tax=Flavobacterium sp. Leaf359 TaxID=1736351 RepID=UPI0006F7B1FC|nr:prolipoprotein diacylglyceryl transferase [Flavobacterium sp. Leaf359]KQS46167.1 prolipoprotein diacylglyceryl transferase [Flavobacterium sp. Leaf359]MBU7569400.1 prolipoprotein diacylglyceryl transferase [Flavobacterium sp.]PZO34593.1 MAG: prolipoprotein diacylglyceryl transferase [Flavobacteriaceae bacterium]PZQ78721.1 MAG: prolipoprotein diacylglyceryl transferase [Flavobacterium johnsoniae]
MTTALNIVWNPSEGIDLGFFVIRYYSLMFVIAFVLGWYLMKKIYLREGESIEKLDTLFIYTFFATLIGARLGHVIFYQSKLFREDFWSVFLPFKTKPHFEFTGFSGLASHGAAIAIIITMYFYSKNVINRPLLWILDRIVIPVASGAIFVRLGNFFNSEIVGHKTTSPLGIKFLRDSIKPDVAMIETKTNNVNDAYHQIATNPEYAAILQQVAPKHPAQLYEAVGYVIVFFILFFSYWKTQAREKSGYLFGLFLVLLWTVRFLVEFVKESQGGIEESLGLFSTGQWLSIPFILAGLYFIFTAEKKVNSL